MIALYLLTNYSKESNYDSEKKGCSIDIKNENKIYKSIYNLRFQEEKKYENLGYYHPSDIFVFQNEINLAKSHGIYGFAFYYFWNYEKTFIDKPLELFLNYKNIDFHFLLIFAYNNSSFSRNLDKNKTKTLINEGEYFNNWEIKFIKDIKKFMIDKRYIRINFYIIKIKLDCFFEMG